MQNQNNPSISVLMSVYNEEKYLQAAVDSVLNQTFSDFEFIIINDCSTDNSRKILESINDERIKLISNYCNIGLTKSLNIGLESVKGKYIVRMDADDICYHDRLKKQFEFMENNPAIGVCGTGVNIYGTKEYWLPAEKHDQIVVNMLFYNDIYHPTVIIKAELLKSVKYNEEQKTAQDYFLWANLLNITKFHNLQEVLVVRRIHNESIGSKKSEQQQMDADKARNEIFKLLNMKFERKKFESKDKEWFLKILKNNKNYNIFNKKMLKTKYNFYCPNKISKLKRNVFHIING